MMMADEIPPGPPFEKGGSRSVGVSRYDKEKQKRLDHNREPVLFSLLSILGLKIKACVIPVEDEARLLNDWIPAFAGMTG